MMAQAVHAALAAKLAFATRFSPCILKWLLSGTTAEMKTLPVTTQHAQMSRFGGTPTSVNPSKLASVTVRDSGALEWLEAQRLCCLVHCVCVYLTLALTLYTDVSVYLLCPQIADQA